MFASRNFDSNRSNSAAFDRPPLELPASTFSSTSLHSIPESAAAAADSAAADTATEKDYSARQKSFGAANSFESNRQRALNGELELIELGELDDDRSPLAFGDSFPSLENSVNEIDKFYLKSSSFSSSKSIETSEFEFIELARKFESTSYSVGPRRKLEFESKEQEKESQNEIEIEKEEILPQQMKIPILPAANRLRSNSASTFLNRPTSVSAAPISRRVSPVDELFRLSPEEEDTMHLISCAFRCRECLPGIEELKSRKSDERTGEFCCVGSALFSALPNDFPVELLDLTESYLIGDQSTRSFLTRPPPISAGAVQCCIVKTNGRFELFLDLKEQKEIQIARTRLKESKADRWERMRQRKFLSRELFKEVDEDDNETIEFEDRMPFESRLKRSHLKSAILDAAESVLLPGENIFLMSATHKRSLTGSQYTISMDRDVKCDAAILGKVKANFGGSEFLLNENYQREIKKKNGEIVNYQKSTKESALIQFDHFLDGPGSPIRLRVKLPNSEFHQSNSSSNQSSSSSSSPSQVPANYNSSSLSKVWKSQHSNNSESADEKSTDEDNQRNNQSFVSSNSSAQAKPRPSRAKKNYSLNATNTRTPGLKVEGYENLQPVWHEAMGAFVLHFDYHRVREKSVKNFKLVRTNEKEKRTILQFGRIRDRNVFIMDFAYPMTAIQAFAIALSSIDKKIAI